MGVILEGLHVELLTRAELLSLLHRDIENLRFNHDTNSFQVGRHLKVQSKLALIFELEVLISLSHWNSINIIESGDSHFRVLE